MADRFIHVSDDRYKNPGMLPNEWKYQEYNVCGLRLDTSSNIIAKGWRICEFVNETYDSEIQERSLPAKDIQATKAVFTYIVTDKPLNPYRKLRGRQFKQEGWAILLVKYPDEFDRKGAAYDADYTTFKNYYINTLTPAVTVASTVQKVKDVLATWPII